MSIKVGIILSCLLSSLHMMAQIDSTGDVSRFDSIANIRPPADFTFPIKDSIQVKLADEGLDDPVNYTAKDSMRFDIIKEQIHLYGNAVVTYQNYEMTAGYIIFDWGQNLVIAEGIADSTGKNSQLPVFNDGKQDPVTAERIKYNFLTKKGVVYDVVTEQSGGYIRGGMAKIVGAQDSVPGSTDQFFSKNATFSTCSHPEPHYGIRSLKQKVIPNKLVVVGPSNLELGGIPTPIWLPFAFFPLTKGESSGLIFPKDYEFNPNLGYGLKNVGWYFPLNDYSDLKLTGNIYTRGSWGLQAVSGYNRRYKYRGNLNLGFSVFKTGDPETPSFNKTNALNIRWSHSQDSKAHPSQSFTASVNFQTQGFNQLNENDEQNVLQNSYSSNITYTKTFPGKPYRLTVNASHSQNTSSNQLRIDIPKVDFRVNKVFPFERKQALDGKIKWYEKIGFTYSASSKNTLNMVDTAINLVEAINDAQFGVQHTLPVSAAFKVFKYFNFTPSINYSEKWYINTLQKEFDPTLLIETDTIYDADGFPVSISSDTTFGTVNELENRGFRSLREFSAGASLSTQLFGMLPIGKGQAIRHVVKPNFSFTYTPDYTKPAWGYFDSVQTDTRYPLELQEYNIFQGGVYGQASRGGSQAISFSIGNVIEGKFRNRKDTAFSLKKVKIIQNLNIRGSYNIAADSLNMSTINLNGNTKLFKQVNVNFAATLDPLAANIYNNGRIQEWEIQKNGRLARLTNASLSFSFNIDPKKFADVFNNNGDPDLPESDAPEINSSQPQNKSFIQRLSLRYEVRVIQKYFDGVDSLYFSTNNIRLSGTAVNLTENWKLNIGGIGYEFTQKQFTYPDFSLYRNLHCWEMGISWQPQRGTYRFYLRVRPGSQLDFLNIPYQRSNFNPLGGF